MGIRQYKIGIDPGHGGSDPGAIGLGGTKEKDITLAISRELETLLISAGFAVVITRREDVAVDLRLRDDVFNNAACDYAVSIHCNASTSRAANYIATFIQSAGGQAEQLARRVQAQLVTATGWPDGGVRVRNLHMTRETNMPAILVECGFISNTTQELELKQAGMQQKLARAIALGLAEHLGRGGAPVAEQWKQDIIAEAKKEGIITSDHDPDETATKWFVLAVAVNVLKAVKKLLGK